MSESTGDYQEGFSLPQRLYTAPEAHAADMDLVFARNWLFAGHSCELNGAGAFFQVRIGNDSVVVLRDKVGGLRAFHNVCRHRGSELVQEACGRTQMLVCPYHQWAYGLDGTLHNARLMGDDFPREEYSLRPVEVRDLAGLVFVCLADDPPPWGDAEAAIAPQLGPHRLDRAKVACRHSYRVQANWKVLVENNRECYHCRGTHPAFCQTNWDLGMPGDSRQNEDFEQALCEARPHWEKLGLAPKEISFPDGTWFRVARYPLKPGCATESLSGDLVAPLMGDIDLRGAGSLRLIGLPNFWAHANPDYAMTTRLLPLSPSETLVDVVFLVHADAQEGVDYNPDRVADVLRLTSEEDWQLCQGNFRGIQSRAYSPGPLSKDVESSVAGFHEWYLRNLRG